jgi:hypothetical protein
MEIKTKISDYQIGQSVHVKITDARTGKDVWRDGIVIDKGMIYPSAGSHHAPYPKVTVKYIHTYYRKLKDNYNGIVWIGEEGEFYDKENESLFIYETEIKPR